VWRKHWAEMPIVLKVQPYRLRDISTPPRQLSLFLTYFEDYIALEKLGVVPP
jgi:hypothetical protein